MKGKSAIPFSAHHIRVHDNESDADWNWSCRTLAEVPMHHNQKSDYDNLKMLPAEINNPQIRVLMMLIFVVGE